MSASVHTSTPLGWEYSKLIKQNKTTHQKLTWGADQKSHFLPGKHWVALVVNNKKINNGIMCKFYHNISGLFTNLINL